MRFSSEPSNSKSGANTPAQASAQGSTPQSVSADDSLNFPLGQERTLQTILSIVQPTLDILTKRVGEFDFSLLEKNPLVATTCTLLLMYHPDRGRQSWAALKATNTLANNLVVAAIPPNERDALPRQARNHMRNLEVENPFYPGSADRSFTAPISAPDGSPLATHADQLSVDVRSNGDSYALKAFALLSPFASQCLPVSEFSDSPLMEFWKIFAHDLEMLSFAASFASLQGDPQTRSCVLHLIDELNPQIGEVVSPLIEKAIAESPFHQTRHMSDEEYLSWLLGNP